MLIQGITCVLFTTHAQRKHVTHVVVAIYLAKTCLESLVILEMTMPLGPYERHHVITLYNHLEKSSISELVAILACERVYTTR